MSGLTGNDGVWFGEGDVFVVDSEVHFGLGGGGVVVTFLCGLID